jgi:hypothetical protein
MLMRSTARFRWNGRSVSPERQLARLGQSRRRRFGLITITALAITTGLAITMGRGITGQDITTRAAIIVGTAIGIKLPISSCWQGTGYLPNH